MKRLRTDEFLSSAASEDTSLILMERRELAETGFHLILKEWFYRFDRITLLLYSSWRVLNILICMYLKSLYSLWNDVRVASSRIEKLWTWLLWFGRWDSALPYIWWVVCWKNLWNYCLIWKNWSDECNRTFHPALRLRGVVLLVLFQMCGLVRKNLIKNVYRIAYSEYHRIHLLDVCAR